MPAQTDFNQMLDRAAALVADAICNVREASLGRLPAPHRRLTSQAIRDLEHGQLAMFQARNDPWRSAPPRNRQLELL